MALVENRHTRSNNALYNISGVLKQIISAHLVFLLNIFCIIHPKVISWMHTSFIVLRYLFFFLALSYNCILLLHYLIAMRTIFGHMETSSNTLCRSEAHFRADRWSTHKTVKGSLCPQLVFGIILMDGNRKTSEMIFGARSVEGTQDVTLGMHEP